jgi:hypothetical protein
VTPEHAQWIADYVAREGSVWMKCVEACEEMAAAFPELRVIKGIAVSSVSGKRWCHCWLLAADDEVIDPTVAQFGGFPVTYEAPSR